MKFLNALHAARRSFVASEAEERIRRALRSKVRASEQVYRNGDRVFYKRDGQERWLGPGKVVFQDGRIVFVRHGSVFVRVSPNRLIKAGSEFSTENGNVTDNVQSNPVNKREIEHRPHEGLQDEVEEQCELQGTGNIQDDAADQQASASTEEENLIKGIMEDVQKGDHVEYQLPDSDKWITATILGRGGKSSGQYKHWINIRDDESGEEKSIDLDKVQLLSRRDDVEVNIVMIPRNRHGEDGCVQAKLDELQKLKQFNTYEEVVDTGQNRISTTWVLWMKGEQVRARLVARGFEDEDEFRSDSPTVSKSVVKIMLAVASSKGWKVKTTDIKSAFLQGKKIEREVYLIPPKEADTELGKLWKLKHCLYGLNDAARQFYQSVEAMLQIGCEQSSLDPALFYFKRDGIIMGMMSSHIDDFLHAGCEEFDKMVMDRLRNRFLAGKLEEVQFTYIGFDILQK